MTDYHFIVLVCILGVLGEAVRLQRPGQAQLGPDWLGRYRLHGPSDGSTTLQVLTLFPLGPTFALRAHPRPADLSPQQHLDAPRAAAAAGLVREAARLVEPFSQLMFLLLTVVTPLALILGVIPYPWYVLGGALLLIELPLLATFTVAHRRVFPGHTGQLVQNLIMMALFPPAGVFAGERLAHGALNRVHPLAAVLALCPEAEARRVAGKFLRAWSHPLPGEDADAARQYLQAAAAALQDRGWDPAGFTAAPAADGGAGRSYCPRCRAQFLTTGGECPDCLGVAKVEFTSRSE